MLPPPPRSTLFPYTTLFRSHLLEQFRFYLPQFQAACVTSDGIYHRVQIAMFGKDSLHELPHSCFVSNIDFMTLEASSISRRGVLERFPFRLIAIGNGNHGALLEKGRSYGAPQSAGATGYENHAAFESRTHCSTSSKGTLLSALFEEFRDEAGPSSLMAGSKAGTVVAMEILIEQNQVAPMGIALKNFRSTGDGAAAGAIA